MNINRNNYEEYFLLYVDNELSAADKNVVVAFLTENPDLQEELLMLQQSVAKPDTVIFAEKENLLKPNPVDAGTEEKLLLLLDNELTEKEKQQVAILTESDRAIKEAWQLLQQTKLSPADVIIFEDKASLYKKEERRVVSIRWWQMAAAAMLVGFGLWGTVSYLNRNSKLPSSSETATTKGKIKTDDANTATMDVKDTVQSAVQIINPTETATKTKQNKTAPEKILVPVRNTRPDVLKQKNNDMVHQQKNDLPKPIFNNLNNNDSNKPAIVIVSPQKQEIKTIPNNEGAQIKTIPSKMIAVNTTFIDNGNSNEKDLVFDEEQDDKSKKSKIGSFFKKVKRVLERKTKINTGSGDEIKIANMSFAMH